MSSRSTSHDSSVSRSRQDSQAARIAAKWRQMVGIALLWVAISAAVYVPQATANQWWVAVVGFIAFAAGLSLFAEGSKRDILADLRSRDTD
jgi:1,4-dihydroxy-2-naphthoate octaprenyltransferase